MAHDITLVPSTSSPASPCARVAPRAAGAEVALAHRHRPALGAASLQMLGSSTLEYDAAGAFHDARDHDVPIVGVAYVVTPVLPLLVSPVSSSVICEGMHPVGVCGIQIAELGVNSATPERAASAVRSRPLRLACRWTSPAPRAPQVLVYTPAAHRERAPRAPDVAAPRAQPVRGSRGVWGRRGPERDAERVVAISIHLVRNR